MVHFKVCFSSVCLFSGDNEEKNETAVVFVSS